MSFVTFTRGGKKGFIGKILGLFEVKIFEPKLVVEVSF